MTPKETIIIERIRLETHQRLSKSQWLDLTQYLTNVEITEDIFSNNSIATLFLAETANIISSPLNESYTPGPIIGNERVYITFFNPLNDIKIDVKFRIHAISGKMLLNTKSLGYALHLVSEDTLTNSKIKISQSFKSKKYSDVVQAILKNDIKTDRDLLISPTDKPKNFVVPYWSPFKALNWLCSRSISSSYLGAGFILFENVLRNRYVFASLEELYSKESVKDLQTSVANIYDPSSEAGEGIERTKTRVNKWHSAHSFDLMQNLGMGMYANTLLQYDTLNKTYSKKIFDYEIEFPKLQHLDPGKLVSPLLDKFDKRLSDYPEQNITMYPRAVSIVEDDSAKTFIPYRRSQLQQLNNIKIRIKVAGDFNLNTGDCVNLKIASVFNSLVDIKTQKMWDKYYSGKYLITGIKHTIGFEVYAMTIELSKDTLLAKPETEPQLSLV